MNSESSTPTNLPRGYIQTSPYWDGLRERRLVLQVCLDTGRFQHYPRPTSIFTGSQNLGWQEASGRGRLVAWTQVNKTSPHMQGIVELDEGVQILALVLTANESHQLRVGQQVALTWPDSRLPLTGPIFIPTSD